MLSTLSPVQDTGYLQEEQAQCRHVKLHRFLQDKQPSPERG